MMKRFFSVFLAIILITTLFGCKKAEVPETTTETTQTTTTTTQPVTQAQPKDINPLTGSKKFNPKAIGRRPVAISIENQPQARPQWGITTPDIIIEGETEGGISRMLWLYADYSKVPDKVGPVRSARPSFVVCTELFDSIFIHWGGSHNNKNYKGGYTYIKKHGVDDIDGMKGGKLYGRDKTRSVAIEHRGILYGNRIPSVIKEKKIRKKLNEKKFSTLYFNETQQNAGKRAAPKVKCRFSSISGKRTFTYSKKNKKYHTTDWEKDVAFKNLILLYDETKYITVPYKGSTTTYLNYQSLCNGKGEGTGYYASNGTVRKIYWKIKKKKLYLRDKNNKNIKINKGKSYIGLASSNHGGKIAF